MVRHQQYVHHVKRAMRQRVVQQHIMMKKAIVKQHVLREKLLQQRMRNVRPQRAAGIHWNIQYPRVRHPARTNGLVPQDMQRIHRRSRHITMQKMTVQ